MPERPGGGRARASALSYPGHGAPRVVASGQGSIAERILEEARRAGVPIRQDAALAEALGKLNLGREVPEDLYTAVAETLAWAYCLDTRADRPRP